uniref:Uncharacterized protein n=1 Tax=Cucumis melo TaxID=3656 RepID=A0A9I9EM86_CUCME
MSFHHRNDSDPPPLNTAQPASLHLLRPRKRIGVVV